MVTQMRIDNDKQTKNTDKEDEEYNPSLKSIIAKLKEHQTKYLKNNHASINQVFTVAPKIQLNLLLNFESYNETTKTKDSYLPEEKIIKFNPGVLIFKLNGGKIRITQERINGNPVKYNKNAIPSGAYAVIEDEGKR